MTEQITNGEKLAEATNIGNKASTAATNQLVNNLEKNLEKNNPNLITSEGDKLLAAEVIGSVMPSLGLDNLNLMGTISGSSKAWGSDPLA